MSLKFKNDASKIFERKPQLRYAEGGMPLIKGKSEKSFEKNLKTELEHGHPQKQSLAIAYAMKRKAQRKKMADGGDVNSDPQQLQNVSDSFKKAVHSYSEGGRVKNNYQPEHEETHPDYYAPESHLMGEMESGYEMLPKEHEMMNKMAMSEAGKRLNQHPVDMHAETSMSEQDLVDRIMEKRSMDYSNEARLAEGGYLEGDEMYPHAKNKMFDVTNKYSEGGKVANQEHGENNNSLAGFDPAEYDDLVLRDDLESTYGDDDNAGDALGNSQEDADRADLVDRIMLRSKKSRIPPGYPGR